MSCASRGSGRCLFSDCYRRVSNHAQPAEHHVVICTTEYVTLIDRYMVGANGGEGIEDSAEELE